MPTVRSCRWTTTRTAATATVMVARAATAPAARRATGQPGPAENDGQQHNYKSSLESHAHLHGVESPDDRYSEATILNHLGDAHNDVAAMQAARDAWQQALVILESLGHVDAEKVRAKIQASRGLASVTDLPRP